MSFHPFSSGSKEGLSINNVTSQDSPSLGHASADVRNATAASFKEATAASTDSFVVALSICSTACSICATNCSSAFPASDLSAFSLHCSNSAVKLS